MAAKSAPTALGKTETRPSDVILDIFEEDQGLSLELSQTSRRAVKSLPRFDAPGVPDSKSLDALISCGDDLMAAVLLAQYSLARHLVKALTFDSAA